VYVCICNCIRETELREAARTRPLSCPKQLYASLGKEPQCCQCLDEASEIIAEAVASSGEQIAFA
jgi:bacterioferritin-associated ferredoxin